MAKKQKNTESPAPVTYQAPEGYQKRTDDVVGFWAPEFGPIHFIPREASVSDSKLEPAKQSGLIRGILVDECTLINSDGEQVTGNAGDLVGVWAKPGMRSLKNLSGVKVFMYASGEKDVGKVNAMQLFEVCSAQEGDPLSVDDRRKQSRAHGSWLAPAITRANGAAPEAF
jgi:hypothetical protein